MAFFVFATGCCASASARPRASRPGRQRGAARSRSTASRAGAGPDRHDRDEGRRGVSERVDGEEGEHDCAQRRSPRIATTGSDALGARRGAASPPSATSTNTVQARSRCRRTRSRRGRRGWRRSRRRAPAVSSRPTCAPRDACADQQIGGNWPTSASMPRQATPRSASSTRGSRALLSPNAEGAVRGVGVRRRRTTQQADEGYARGTRKRGREPSGAAGSERVDFVARRPRQMRRVPHLLRRLAVADHHRPARTVRPSSSTAKLAHQAAATTCQLAAYIGQQCRRRLRRRAGATARRLERGGTARRRPPAPSRVVADPDATVEARVAAIATSPTLSPDQQHLTITARGRGRTGSTRAGPSSS